MATYRQLTEQLAKVQAQMHVAREKEMVAAIAQIKEQIAEYGITAEELGFAAKRPRKADSGESVAKYRNPKTGQTWTGRGRKPLWLGKRPDRFLIKD
ncbi:MAG TPA: H-NS histone family protein [Trinickia sp.]|jgi:DNA-binding protein H-NS|uniref:H-NS histone family protein n=1 Tax=Trinickia sp. TaxID=2571163 RepID=UPI002C1C31CD|nr:H-NS histone family protein [Trinickia sp.]HTI18005.1 H-NS histone family protein [Trinickia sp.]